jgi:hypothetical protein
LMGWPSTGPKVPVRCLRTEVTDGT